MATKREVSETLFEKGMGDAAANLNRFLRNGIHEVVAADFAMENAQSDACGTVGYGYSTRTE